MPEAISRRTFAGALCSLASAPAAIPTITGAVSPDALGLTLMHEHLLWFGSPRMDGTGYRPLPEDKRAETVEFVARLLQDAARVGVKTIVDQTPHRPIEVYREIAARTSVRLVVSTGFYRRTKIPREFAAIEDPRVMETRMRREIEDGIGRSGVRAGIIKIASEGSPLSEWEKKVFRAAAHVQRATGTPICTHLGGDPREHLGILTRAGADPRRVMLSHIDTVGPSREKVLETMIAIAREGAYLEVDTFGQEFYTPWADLVYCLRGVCDAGFAHHLFIDVDSNWRWNQGVKVFEGGDPPNSDPHAADRIFAYMITAAVPRLMTSGFTRREIDTFLTDNPRRFFGAV